MYICASFNSWRGSNNDLNPSTTGLVWNIGSLAGGANRILTFQAVVDTGAKGTYGTVTNTAAMTAVDQTDTTGANDSSAIGINVTGIDLELVKTVNDATPEEGETVTYTVTVENLSGQTATNVLITDVVPAGVTYVGSSITGGTSNDDTNPSTTGLTWTIASIATGVTETLTFQAAVITGAKVTHSTITNTASIISFDQTEESAGNNTDTAVVTPVGIDLQAVKTVDVASPVEGTYSNLHR